MRRSYVSQVSYQEQCEQFTTLCSTWLIQVQCNAWYARADMKQQSAISINVTSVAMQYQLNSQNYCQKYKKHDNHQVPAPLQTAYRWQMLPAHTHLDTLFDTRSGQKLSHEVKRTIRA